MHLQSTIAVALGVAGIAKSAPVNKRESTGFDVNMSMGGEGSPLAMPFNMLNGITLVSMHQ